MKKLFTAVSVCLLVSATAVFAQDNRATNLNIHVFPDKAHVSNFAGAGGSSNLSYHSGGATITLAHVVFIFWGPNFNNTASADYSYAQTLGNFRNNFGGTAEYNVITQYYNNIGGTTNYIQLTNLAGNATANPDWFDTTQPPNNVSDSVTQCEVKEYLAPLNSDPGCGLGPKGQGHATDYSAIYEVVLPASNGSGAVYSSSGSSDSCGGPNLQYCAYHSHYTDATTQNVKYSIEPYPSCSGCQATGFNDVQNQEHFVCHETREAVTDSLGNAWYDRRGNEADDKCAWTPAPFIDSTTGYGYQYEWSNANGGCVQTR